MNCRTVQFSASGAIDTLYLSAQELSASLQDHSLGSVRRLSLKVEKINGDIHFEELRKIMNEQSEAILKWLCGQAPCLREVGESSSLVNFEEFREHQEKKKKEGQEQIKEM